MPNAPWSVVPSRGIRPMSIVGSTFNIQASQSPLSVYPIQTIRGYQAGLESLCFSPDGSLLATTDSFTIRLLQRETANNYSLQQIIPVPATTLAFSPDGHSLAYILFNGALHIWSIDQEQYFELVASEDHATSVAFASTEPRMIVGTQAGVIQLWESTTWTRLASFSVADEAVEAPSPISHLAFTSDSNHLVCSCSDRIIMVHLLSAEFEEPHQQSGGGIALVSLVSAVMEPGRNPLGFCISSDRQSLAISGYADARVWILDLPTLALRDILQLPDNDQLLVALAFSPAGRWLAGATYEGWVWIWQVSSRNLVTRFPAHTEGQTIDSEVTAIKSLCWTPDGRFLLTGGALAATFYDTEYRCFSGPNDYTVKVWLVETH
jgi:WD40 repeat protein